MVLKKQNVRVIACAFLAFFLPTAIARYILNLFGNNVAKGVRIGFSWVQSPYINLDKKSKIGHFNFITVNRLILHKESYIGRGNILKGPFSVLLSVRSGIGNENRVLRGGLGVTSGSSYLCLGELAKITANHRIDCTQSVKIGAFSILAGAGSQLWTHGYVHEMDGAGRYRIDGRIEIENNVYIGSACLISMGVRIAKGVIVGGGTTVSGSLTEPGLYVSSPIRVLPRPDEPQNRSALHRLTDPHLVEPVYLKSRP